MSTLLEAPAALSVGEITSACELAALSPEWQALWASSPRATPFQHPAWLLAWWRHLGGGELRTLVVRHAGRLAAVWPMFVWADSARQLTPLGNGVSDHVDLLAAPGHECPTAAAILAHLAGSDDWDTADFRDLPADSPLPAASGTHGITAEVVDDEPCPVLTFPARTANRTSAHELIVPTPSPNGTSPGRVILSAAAAPDPHPHQGLAAAEGAIAGSRDTADGEELTAVIPAELLKKLRYYHRRLDREFTVGWEKATDPPSLETLFDALVRLHTARWGRQGAAGMLDNPRVAAFHRCVAAAFLARGMLRLYALRLDGEVAAAWYGFAANGRVHYYLGGFDPAFDRYSVGTVIVGHAIGQARGERATELDFLRGREAYKYAWGATDRPQRRMHLTRSTGAG
jgi:CelD/BcsL family acetyltransferase involved in cellulose biosynthesis